MKVKVKILFVIMFVGIVIMTGAVTSADEDCTFKGISLRGRVKFVKYNPDIKIKIVKSFPDLEPNDFNVKFVSGCYCYCGQWQVVDYGHEFTVQIVDEDPDFRVRIVDMNPGFQWPHWRERK